MNDEQVYDVWAYRIEMSRRRWRGLAIGLLVALGVSTMSAQVGLVIAGVGAVVVLVAFLLNKYVTKSK